MVTSTAAPAEALESPAPGSGGDRRAPAHAGLPLNYFGMSFGVSGLAGTWSEAARALGSPDAVAEVLWAVAALVWLGTVGVYVARARTARRVGEDLRNPVLGPFAALVPLPPMLLGAHLFATVPVPGAMLVWAAVVISALLGARFLAGLVTAPPGFAAMHGGYLLPTVAAGLVGAQALATIGADDAAVAAFGSGLLFWTLVGAALLARLVAGPPLPGGLLPSFAIFAAPPAVAGNAWWVLSGGAPGFLGHLLAGALVTVVLPHVFLLRRYLAQPFTPGAWAFTFTAAASATFAVRLLTGVPTGWATAGAWLLVAAATVLIGAIGARSLVAWVSSARRGPLSRSRAGGRRRSGGLRGTGRTPRGRGTAGADRRSRP